MTTESVEQVTTGTAEASEEKPLVFQNELHKGQFDMLADFINKRNAVVAKLNAAAGDRDSIAEDVRENSTDPDIVAAREALAEWQARLDALVTPLVEERITNSTGNTEELEKELKDIDGTLKPGLTFFKKLFDDGSAEHLPAQTRMKGTKVSGAGSGTRRIRGFSVTVEIDGETKNFDNFTLAAKYLDVDTAELQKVFFKKAGTDDLKKVPDVVHMVINFDEVDSDGNKTEKEATVKAYRNEAAGIEATPEDETPEETTSPEAEVTEPEVETPDEIDLDSLSDDRL